MASAIDYRRNLGIIPVGKANRIARKNYQISVLDREDVIFWGMRSDQPKTLDLWSELCKGDVNLFIYDKKLAVAGIIVDLYQDPNAYKDIGWHQAEKFDLIIKMKRIDINDPLIMTLLGYKGPPTGFAIACKKKARSFWNKYAPQLPLDPTVLRNAMPAITLKTKGPAEQFNDDARKLTEVNWILDFKSEEPKIDPLRFGRNESWHLDHRFSIAAAYAIGMPAWLVADPVNLHMMPGPENLLKNSKCGSIDPIINKHPEYAYLKDIYNQKLADGSATWTR